MFQTKTQQEQEQAVFGCRWLLCLVFTVDERTESPLRVIGVSGRTGVGEKKIEAMEEQGPQSKERKDKDSRIFLFWLQMQRNTMQVVCKPQKYVMQEKGLIRFDFNDQRRRKKMFSSCLTRNKKGPAAFFNHLANRRIRWQLKWERATLYKRRAKRRKREVEEEAKRANSFDTETHRAFDEQLNFRVIITIDVVNKTTKKRMQCSIRVGTKRMIVLGRKESVELRPATEPKNWCVLFLSLILFLECFLVFLYQTPLLHSYLEF